MKQRKITKMCNLQYCTVCLVTGVKMFSFNLRISSVTIGETFFQVLGIPAKVYNEYICFECTSLLFKHEEFRLKCIRAQSIINAIGEEDAKEIYKHIRNIDRRQHRLTSNLSSSQTEYYNQTSIDSDEQIIDDVDIKNELIKNEDHNEFNFEDVITYEIQDVPFNGNIKDIQINKRKRSKKYVKSKLKFCNNVKQTEKEGLSDDEPLSNKVSKTTEFNKINIAELNERSIAECKEQTIAECNKINIAEHNKKNIAECNEINNQEFKNVTSPIKITKNWKKIKNTNDFEDYATVKFLTPEDAKNEVLLRKESSNYINSQLKCDLCYRGYEAKVAFENHMKKHSVEHGAFKCEICQLRFPEQRYLCKHRLASHKRKFCCKICPYVCFCMHQAKTHVSLHKGKKYPCKECAEVFSMPNSLLMHKRQKHSTECVCDLCGHTFATPRGLYSHHMKLHRHHKNEKLGPKCADCNKHFASEAAWKIHLVLSSKHIVSNGCKFCGETFTTSQELKHHSRVHARKHSTPHNSIPGPCPMCDKWLDDRISYNAHVSSIHPLSEVARKLDAEEPTPFVCEVCGRMFKKQCFLTYHQRKHSGERPYKCTECGKTFHLSGALATHRAVHLNARTHKCGICARVFTFKSVLNKHMKVHLGIRPHRCDICDKSFISPCDVKVHVKYVHNKVPWPKRDRTKRTETSFIQY